jgi:hypothetical protein
MSIFDQQGQLKKSFESKSTIIDMQRGDMIADGTSLFLIRCRLQSDNQSLHCLHVNSCKSLVRVSD